MIRNEHVLRNLGEGRTDQRLGEVPIEVDLDSCKDLPEVHPFSAGKLNPECNLADFTTIKREAPKAQDKPPEAVPILRMQRLTREQLESIFNESSSDKEEDEVFPTTIPEGWQLPTSLTDEYLRPTSAASSRHRPTIPLEDIISEDEDSTEDEEERPLREEEDLTLIARRSTETAYLRDKEKEDPSPTEQGLGIRYSDDIVWTL